MQFEIARTSNPTKLPCAGAYPIPRTDNLNEYAIDIDTLEELLKIAQETRWPVIVKLHSATELPEIEIYDDYRE